MSLTLTDTELYDCIHKQIVTSFHADLEEYVQPASIDLPLGGQAYMVKQKFLPFQQKVQYVVDKITLESRDLSAGATLYRGFTYLIPCLEVNLPKNLKARISPKSSIGRVDVLVRAVLDYSGLYDSLPGGSKGMVWLEVTPQSFNVHVKKGLPLAQIRLFEDVTSSETVKPEFFDANGSSTSPLKVDGKTVLSLAVSGFVGYEAVHTNEVIDLTKRAQYDVSKFFRPVQVQSNKKIVLSKDRFYILGTKENIFVPGNVSVEMVPFSHLVGELRAHYAGFFDPGFGEGKGATGVLEIRPHEMLTVYDGQPIVMIESFMNKSIPSTLYGAAGNNYQNQSGPRLAKYFKQ